MGMDVRQPNETINEPLTVSASMGIPTMVLCNGGSDGSVTVTGSGGTVAVDYTYTWSDGQNTATATGLVGILHSYCKR